MVSNSSSPYPRTFSTILKSFKNTLLVWAQWISCSKTLLATKVIKMIALFSSNILWWTFLYSRYTSTTLRSEVANASTNRIWHLQPRSRSISGWLSRVTLLTARGENIPIISFTPWKICSIFPLSPSKTMFTRSWQMWKPRSNRTLSMFRSIKRLSRLLSASMRLFSLLIFQKKCYTKWLWARSASSH